MLTVGELRKAIEGLPDDAPVFTTEFDPVGITAYEGCSGEPGVLIHLDDEEDADFEDEAH